MKANYRESVMVSHLIEAVRIAIGLIFLVAVFGKLRDPQRFIQGVIDYQILSSPMSALYAIVLIPLEIVIALTFLTGLWLGMSALIGLTVLCTFSVAIVVNMLRNRDIACHCFGANSSERVSWRSLTRIIFLMAGTLLVMMSNPFGWPGTFILSRNLSDWKVSEWLLTGSATLSILIVSSWILTLPDLLRLRRSR